MNNYKMELGADRIDNDAPQTHPVCDGFCTGKMSVGQMTELCIVCNECGRPLSVSFVDRFLRACDIED